MPPSNEDYVYITYDFKLSKNYNSVGGSVGYGSAKKKNETIEKCHARVNEFVLGKLADAIDVSNELLDAVKGSK